MLEEVKLDFSVVPESEKLSLFKNLLIMLLNFMEVTLSLLESEKEPEKETIYIMKWLPQELLMLKDQDLDVLWFMDKWMNHLVPELESDLLD